MVALSLFAGCGEPAREERPPAGRARTVRPTVVSLVPAVTEMLFAIGAGPQVIGVSSFDNWPPEVARLPKVGALLDPDVERILRLRPGVLVLHVSQTELRAQVERAGIRTFSHATGGLADVTKTMRAIGAMVGRAAEADEAAAAMERRLALIGRRAAGRPHPRTLLVFGREPGSLRAIDASGGVGFLHDILTLAGGENVFASQRREAVRVSTEAIIAAAPEVIVDLRYGQALAPGELERERAVWNALASLPAVREGRVRVLAGDRFVIPGPRIVDAAEDIAAAIQMDKGGAPSTSGPLSLPPLLVPRQLDGLQPPLARRVRIVVEPGQLDDPLAQVGEAHRQRVGPRKPLVQRDPDALGVGPRHGWPHGSSHTTSPVTTAWQARRERGVTPQAPSRRSASASSIPVRRSIPSRTITWHVVQAALPPQACSSGKPTLRATSSSDPLRPWRR